MDENIKSIENIHKNGGFPPIKYCGEQKVGKKKLNKERTYSTIPKKNINIRQLLANKNKKLIHIEEEIPEEIEEIEEL
jgi:hypothetical protein